MMASASTSGGSARPWRTALLTLRDESLASSSPTALLELLRRVLLSPATPSLATSAAALSPHEVGSDVAFLADTAAAVASCPGADDALRSVCHLIYDVMCKTNMEIDSSGCLAMLKFLDILVKCSIEGACMKGLSSRTAALNTTSECLHILRFWSRDYGRSVSLTESSHSLTVLVSIVSYLQAELNISDKPANATGISSHNSGSVNSKNSNIWDMKISAFSMVEDILSKVASNMTENLWQSVIEVLRKVMDFVTARNLVIESSVMSRSSSPPTLAPKETRTDSKPRASHGRYRPPHLRNKDGGENDSLEGRNSDSEYSRYDISSSDSDLSDSDGYAKSGDRFRSSKARLAAILCVQDICRADPKLLTSQWPVLLPENDVLQQRKYQATLMTCLLFDPITKVRVEAASTIASMLEGQALVLIQVAEYKESSKRGSFTTLSSSLGQILMQLHTGALYLIQRETQATLLAALFRFLILLISATPFEDQKYDANFGPSGPKEESSIKERCLVAGIKVMDECLRVSSGFKGADDIKECRLLDIQQISDCTINKTIKSAPHFEMEAAGSSQNCSLDITLGTSRWIEVIETHLPQGLSHGSAMVHAALNDMVPSVRSAGGRAIGIVACFPQILSSLS
ncbi:unnamed protein product [Miscanthus lutarioriparius]|uniref:DUF4042 domain-containing protein n=1 Tax=Miscanthus lutarioriparius TaxID=422564 RepID=A0A811SMJ5_9POAL|nr:unnamed protein product [Miscanthus lutarioriparius]